MNRDFKIVDMRRFFVLLIALLISGCGTAPKDLVLNQKALGFCLKKQYDEGISACNQALAINPASWNTYQVRALCYQSKGNYDQAIADYTRMFKTLPPHLNGAGALTNRGYCYSLKGNYDQAIADYRRALEISPGFLPAIHGYENVLKAQMREAREHYDPAPAPRQKVPLSAQEPSDDSWLSDAKRAHRKGDYDRVIELCNRALKRNPEDARAYYYKGFAFAKMGLDDAALADYTRAIELDPNHFGAYHNRGVCYAKKGEYSRAIADYNMALRLVAQNPVTYYCRAHAYERLGQLSEALEDARKALSFKPDHVEYQKLVRDLEVKFVRDLEVKLKTRHSSLQQGKPETPIAVNIHAIETRPISVRPGSKFDLAVQYSVTDFTIKWKQIPAVFTYQIYQGENVLFESKPVKVMVVNGAKTQRIVHLTAANKQGNYKIRAIVKYETKKVGRATEFKIE